MRPDKRCSVQVARGKIRAEPGRSGDPQGVRSGVAIELASIRRRHREMCGKRPSEAWPALASSSALSVVCHLFVMSRSVGRGGLILQLASKWIFCEGLE